MLRFLVKFRRKKYHFLIDLKLESVCYFVLIYSKIIQFYHNVKNDKIELTMIKLENIIELHHFD